MKRWRTNGAARRCLVAAALAVLLAAKAVGFAVSVEKTQYYIGLGLVVRQSPSAGLKAPKGSTITIAVV